MDYNKLLNKAVEIQKNESYGLSKDLDEYAFTFVYPPPQCLYRIREEEVIANAKRKCANIYLHIPYCTGKCTYCYFCRYDLKNSPVSKAEYVDLLCDEIRLAKEKLGCYDVNSIHIGGGTPTTLTEKEFFQIFTTLRENFNIPPNIEITCESSPETLSDDKLKLLTSLGVNRLNIGVQSFDDTVLSIINRRHNEKQAKKAILLAQDIGLKNINIDLMYGVWIRTAGSWKALQQTKQDNR